MFVFVAGREVTDDELAHLGIAGYLGGLHSRGMEGFLGSGRIGLGKGAFVEEQVHSLYLWNDAFKYDHDKLFKPEYRTLEELLKGFYTYKFGIFVSQLGFNDVPALGDAAATMTGSLSEEEHLRNKNPELVELYATIREMVRQRVPNLQTYTPNSKAYIGLGSEDSKRKSFAEFVVKREYLSLEIEKPTNEDLQKLGMEIEYNGSHDHYFKIIVNEESDLDQVVAAIIDSYEQLKKGN